MRKKRISAFLLTLLMLFSIMPLPAEAATNVIFTAVNETLLDLNDETQPFSKNGELYVPYTVVSGGELGIYYSRLRDKAQVVLYRQRSVLTFDLARGTAEGDGVSYSQTAIARNDVIFLPMSVLTSFFSLNYTYTRISYGSLLRVKNASSVLTDAAFLDAADAMLAQQYARYERTHGSSQTNPQQSDTPRGQSTVHLVLTLDRADAAANALNTLRQYGAYATLAFPDTALAENGDALRRAAASGHAIALQIDATNKESILRRIAAGNETLWRSANLKTRLVYLTAADAATAETVAAAGYCPIRIGVTAGNARAASLSERILTSAVRGGKNCTAYLGRAGALPYALSSLLTALRSGGGTMTRLNETNA